MSKRNVSYVKPQEPSFLRKIKEEIGYKEGPTLDTKRQKLENESDSGDDGEVEEEKPQVVVLKAGDLTAEEADAEKKRIEKEEIEKPADLNQRIVFKGKHKGAAETKLSSTSGKDKKSKKADKELRNKLSFNDEEDAEDS